MAKLSGPTLGLAPQQISAAERLFRRRVPPQELVSLQVLRDISDWTADTGRRIGVFIDRRGRIIDVVLGTSEKLDLPEHLKKGRSTERFCGVRWIATGPFHDEPSKQDLTVLLRARFDTYLQVAVTEDGRPWSCREVFLKPPNPETQKQQIYEISDTLSPRDLRTDFLDFIQALETEFERSLPVTQTTPGLEPERAILVTAGTENKRQLVRRETELIELVTGTTRIIVGRLIQRRESLDNKTVVGAGFCEDIAVQCVRTKAEVVVFNCNLTGSQANALEERLGVTVLDRTQIILELFARSVRSSAGRLQVELAQLKYDFPRLRGSGSELSQIGAGARTHKGIGANRGVGETKLELDRRSARRRIETLEKKINKMRRRREMRRSRRARNDVLHIAIIGYTNAGKSTLFNRLTGATVFSANQLFSTLDPTVRRRRLDSDTRLVLSDTVGFIEDLPEDLVQAFGATLEELQDACLLLHVADASASDVHLKVESVRALLKQLNLDQIPQKLIFNKCDLVEVDSFKPLARKIDSNPAFLSAQTGLGIDQLTSDLDRFLANLALPANN